MSKKERKELLRSLNKNRAALDMPELDGVPDWMIYKEKTK